MLPLNRDPYFGTSIESEGFLSEFHPDTGIFGQTRRLPSTAATSFINTVKALRASNLWSLDFAIAQTTPVSCLKNEVCSKSASCLSTSKSLSGVLRVLAQFVSSSLCAHGKASSKPLRKLEKWHGLFPSLAHAGQFILSQLQPQKGTRSHSSSERGQNYPNSVTERTHQTRCLQDSWSYWPLWCDVIKQHMQMAAILPSGNLM